MKIPDKHETLGVTSSNKQKRTGDKVAREKYGTQHTLQGRPPTSLEGNTPLRTASREQKDAITR